jgi:hypothetical protein
MDDSKNLIDLLETKNLLLLSSIPPKIGLMRNCVTKTFVTFDESILSALPYVVIRITKSGEFSHFVPLFALGSF